jgi:hypothetical protein
MHKALITRDRLEDPVKRHLSIVDSEDIYYLSCASAMSPANYLSSGSSALLHSITTGTRPLDD